MPIYVYQCTTCDEIIEANQPFDDDPLVTCPNCGLDKLKRKIQSVSIKFIGNGFYINDNKKE